MNVLTVKFKNESKLPDSDVSIGFVPGGANAFNLSYSARKDMPLEIGILPLNKTKGNGNWYKLEELQDGVQIENFSGRIYVSYGETWKVLKNGYEPAQNITDPNFFLRYDKMELTFNGKATDVADLTSIDYWSIPMKLETSYKNTSVQTDLGNKKGVTSSQIYNALNILTTPPKSGQSNAKPALVPGTFKQNANQPGSGFARIIGPSSYPPIGGVPVIPYNLFNDYLTFLNENFGKTPIANPIIIEGLGNGVIATISGHFNGVGPNVPSSGPQSAQDYDLKASIDADLNVTLKGKIGITETTMEFTKANLISPVGIYGANAAFSLNKGSEENPANDVYGWITGDLLAGFNIGAIGSVTEINQEKVGAMKSSSWFSKVPNTKLFSNLQSKTTNYNQYAAALQPLSDAYNFAYSDRFSAVQISLNPATVDELQLSFFNVETLL
ncbi:beta-1,3-glucanase family protein [Tenacibaculum ovolyticum]|uniref:beta-1,3-glucanase family protein n=1 Tax=Tenacibaculum ovolyticum TaxID=104270 RepID=UPI0022F3A96D|nr:beta-1,3-glucanase family protein [Tenacibaculum ovolyticum]WBX76008.1 beta-1,3-glucanase family protein [Tenacibaculum ovolyticum]